jgi:hypothetical protein
LTHGKYWRRLYTARQSNTEQERFMTSTFSLFARTSASPRWVRIEITEAQGRDEDLLVSEAVKLWKAVGEAMVVRDGEVYTWLAPKGTDMRTATCPDVPLI